MTVRMRLTVVGCSGSFPGPDEPRLLLPGRGRRVRARARPRQRRARPAAAAPRPRRHRRGAAQPPARRPLPRPAAALRRAVPTTRGPPRPASRCTAPAAPAGHLARAYGLADEPGLTRRVRLRRRGRAGPRQLGPFTVTAVRVDPPGRGLGDAGRARRPGCWSTPATPARATRWSSSAGAPTCCCARRPSTTAATSRAADLHLTAEAAEHATRAGVRPAGAHPPAAVERPRGGLAEAPAGVRRPGRAGPAGRDVRAVSTAASQGASRHDSHRRSHGPTSCGR